MNQESRIRDGLMVIIITSCFLIPISIRASTVTFSPSTANVRPGQVISVQIYVDPQGSAYTAKIVLSFTPGILSYSSFSQASGWLPLTQPGYDSADNLSGRVVKTAGYAGGISSPHLFGTATFVANASGVASISVSSGTEILNSLNQNTFTGGGQVSVSVTTPVPAPTPVPVQSAPNPARPLANTSSVATTTATSTASTTSELVSTSTLPAQASSAPNIPYNIIIPIATFLLGFALGRMRV